MKEVTLSLSSVVILLLFFFFSSWCLFLLKWTGQAWHIRRPCLAENIFNSNLLEAWLWVVQCPWNWQFKNQDRLTHPFHIWRLKKEKNKIRHILQFTAYRSLRPGCRSSAQAAKLYPNTQTENLKLSCCNSDFHKGHQTIL